MHITSITVRNYRVHRELHVQLDRALTLIGGRNESGKSTLIEATHRALFLKAKATGEVQREMISTQHGGHPEVEVSFNAGNCDYRIHKRFSGASGTAMLTEVNGPTWHGDEAESRLASLLGVEVVAGGRGLSDRITRQWAHLWVWQGKSGDNPSGFASEHKDALIARLQTGGATAAVQSQLDNDVATSVADTVATLFNANGTAKKDSDAGRALQAEQEAIERCNVALEDVSRLQQAITDSEEAASSISTAETSTRQLTDSLLSLRRQASQVESLKSAEEKQAAAADRASDDSTAFEGIEERIRGLQENVQRGAESLAPVRAELTRLEECVVTSVTDAKKAESCHQDAVSKSRHEQRKHDLALAYVARFETSRQADALRRRQEQAHQGRAEINDFKRHLADLPNICSKDTDELRGLERDRASATAALEAMAAAIDVVCADVAVEVDGKPLTVGKPQIITDDAEITVGTGVRLKISPGGGNSLAGQRQLVEGLRTSLIQRLDELGLSSTTEAEQVLDRRTSLQSDIRTREAQLDGLGERSIDVDCEAASNSARTAELEVERRQNLIPDFPAPATIEEAREAVHLVAQAFTASEDFESEMKSNRDAANTHRDNTDRLLTERRLQLQQEEQSYQTHFAQLQLMTETHGDQEKRDAKRCTLNEARDAAEAALRSTREALAELNPEQLHLDITRLERALENSRTLKSDAQVKLGVAQGLLRSDGTNDPQAAVDLAEAQMHSASERRVSMQRRADAMKLLDELFRSEQKNLAAQLTRPFLDRINAYLSCVFGAKTDADLQLQDNEFGGLSLVRPDDQIGAFAFETLSAGAREQVAAAVRLALAELLAQEHDGSLPVLFDDAFAYSDTDRNAALQRMLDRAAQCGLQVIVLSCNPSDYAALGAANVRIVSGSHQQLRTEGAQSADDKRGKESGTFPSAMTSEGDGVTESNWKALIEALETLGGSAGNGALRPVLGWDEDTYSQVKDALVSDGLLIPGRGRGGTVSLANDLR